MPRLWNDTIETHRQAVRDATLDATAALVAEQGLAAVTMSRIAETTGIGRATLYKYFPDVEAILVAWHERQIGRHLDHLLQVRDATIDPPARLAAVLDAYAAMSHHHHDTALAAMLHRGEHVIDAQQRLCQLLRDLIADDASAGRLRDDVPPQELALYCLAAIAAAPAMPSMAAVRRLVAVTLDGLRSRS